MSEARDPRLCVTEDGDRAPDVTQRPQYKREVEHRGDAGVVSEPERQTVVAPGLKQGDSLFKMLPCFMVLSGEPMRASSRAVSHSGLGGIGIGPDVTEEGLSMSPHRRKLASH
jgi:hypothetical protein